MSTSSSDTSSREKRLRARGYRSAKSSPLAPETPQTQVSRSSDGRVVFGYDALVADILQYAAGTLKEMVSVSLVSRCFRRAVGLCMLDVDFRNSSNDNTLRSLGDMAMRKMQVLDFSGCRDGITDVGVGCLG